MNLKENIIMIGLGNTGCKIAKLFVDAGYQGMFANGSEQDLKVLGNLKNIYKLNEFDGFGGHRERALSCLSKNMEFVSALENIKQKIAFVIYAGGGSTGNGLSDVVCSILLEKVDEEENPIKIVCPVPVLPSNDESIVKHKNAYKAIKDIQNIEGLGATLFIDNNKVQMENKIQNLKWINNTFFSLLNAFITDESYGEVNNFDSSERIEMLKDSGAMVISLLGKDKQEKLLPSLKDNIFAPIQQDKICTNIAIINSTEKGVNMDAIIAEVGKPSNVFEGWGGKVTLTVISGLTYPVDHIIKLGELAKEGQAERIRSRAAVRELDELDFMEEKKVKVQEKEKKPSKLELLRKLNV